MKRLNNVTPVFSIDGESRFDFSQGEVGNCWFLAAILSLTLNKKLMMQVVPLDQSFDNYAGIFHFRFWRFGQWVDVVIDDYLPMLGNEFFSVHSKTPNEFWAPLLEKAYAKVCGSYADMKGGLTSEACKDLTGNLSIHFNPLQRDGDEEWLWKILSYGSRCKSMMCCGTPSVDKKTLVNNVMKNGLVDGHAYSVTRVTEVWHQGSKVKLIRLLNPWGEQEWNGKWSDSSDLWKELSTEDRAKCDNSDNGEFWIELEDFFQNFDTLSVCCENPNFMDGDLGCQWQLMIHDGTWDTAGGNLNHSTFYTNPQFRIQVNIKNEVEEDDMNVFVSLMQKPSVKNSYFEIVATIFQVPPGTSAGRLGQSFFKKKELIKATTVSFEQRELTAWLSLNPGEYLIVPYTMEQYIRAEFVLSIYTKADVTIHPFKGEDDDDHDNDDENKEDQLVLPEIPTDNEDNESKKIFERYASLRGELNSRQLQKLLNDTFVRGNRKGFDRSTCMALISQLDTDHRKQMMNFENFSKLWEKMNKYKQIFVDADINRNGVLDQAELKKAIRAAGINPNDQWMDIAMFRFTFGSTNINLQNFLVLIMRLDKMSSFFNDRATDGVLALNIDDWYLNAIF